jgi:protein-L-isoaspartate(D-aspartate) O-methyltransferase
MARTRIGQLTVAAVLVASVAACGGRAEPSELLTAPPAQTPAGTTTAASPPSGPSSAASLAVPSALDRDLADTPERRAAREELVRDWIEPQVKDTRVLDAMRSVPRHAFVRTEDLDEAYADYPLAIGHGQTISQPSLVARMTELLELQDGERVLEIGTGSGYQAAILAELTDEVYSVEIVPALAGIARGVLDGLGYAGVRVERRDGYLGWPDRAPFDAIIVTAAPDHLPQPLVQQLRPDGGRMVIPIGPVGDVQTLWLVTRVAGETKMEQLLDVRFVPLVREDGAAGSPAP